MNQEWVLKLILARLLHHLHLSSIWDETFRSLSRIRYSLDRTDAPKVNTKLWTYWDRS